MKKSELKKLVREVLTEWTPRKTPLKKDELIKAVGILKKMHSDLSNYEKQLAPFAGGIDKPFEQTLDDLMNSLESVISYLSGEMKHHEDF